MGGDRKDSVWPCKGYVWSLDQFNLLTFYCPLSSTHCNLKWKHQFKIKTPCLLSASFFLSAQWQNCIVNVKFTYGINQNINVVFNLWPFDCVINLYLKWYVEAKYKSVAIFLKILFLINLTTHVQHLKQLQKTCCKYTRNK